MADEKSGPGKRRRDLNRESRTLEVKVRLYLLVLQAVLVGIRLWDAMRHLWG